MKNSAACGMWILDPSNCWRKSSRTSSGCCSKNVQPRPSTTPRCPSGWKKSRCNSSWITRRSQRALDGSLICSAKRGSSRAGALACADVSAGPDERVLHARRDLLEHVGIGALPAGKYREAAVTGNGKYDTVVALLVEPLWFGYGLMRENHHRYRSHFRLDHQVRNVVSAK